MDISDQSASTYVTAVIQQKLVTNLPETVRRDVQPDGQAPLVRRVSIKFYRCYFELHILIIVISLRSVSP